MKVKQYIVERGKVLWLIKENHFGFVNFPENYKILSEVVAIGKTPAGKIAKTKAGDHYLVFADNSVSKYNLPIIPK